MRKQPLVSSYAMSLIACRGANFSITMAYTMAEMARCTMCGVEVDLPFLCPYCRKAYCLHHRLPETHACPNLSLARAPPPITPQRPVQRIRLGTSFPAARFRGFGGSELQQLLIAWLVLGFCFSASAIFRPAHFPMLFGASLITLGLGFVGHELAHRYVARTYGYWAEFRLWPWGLAMAIVFALVSGGRMIFAAPGAVHILPTSFGYGTSRKESGLISLSGPLANLLVAPVFLPLTGFGGLLELIGSTGFRINLWLAAFNLLPFGMLDGRKVFSWSPMAWSVIAIPAWLMIFLPQIF